MDFIADFKITKAAKSQVKIEGEVPFAELEKQRSKAIAHLGTNIELDGFRKGHVPEKVLVDKVGEMAILTEMAERALAIIYPEVLKEHSIDAIGRPYIQITKIAIGNPLGFTATVPVVPEVTLPDYKKIATEINKEKESVVITDMEVEKQAEDIIRQKAAYERLQAKAMQKAESKNKDLDGTTELPTPDTVNKNEELPKLTDEYVKTLGTPGQFESVEDFKKKLREHLSTEKERNVHASHRAKITDQIIEETGIELPQILIDSEIGQMFAQMGEDLKRANLKLDDYLEHIKKTEADLKKEWTPAAEKRARLQLVLNEIAKKEGIAPDKAQLEIQVEKLLEQYKDADETQVRVYVASVMTNEAVMQHLENL